MPLAVAGGGSEARVALQRLFGRDRGARRLGAALYEAVVDQSRRPAFYRELGAPDTLEGRFEVYALHLSLLVLRLRQEGPAGAAAAQSLFDCFVRGLDDGLREMGVGDTTVPKRMRTFGQALYGRMQGYETAFGALPELADLEALIGRTILSDSAEPPGRLAAYAARARSELAKRPAERLLNGDVTWPEPEQ